LHSFIKNRKSRLNIYSKNKLLDAFFHTMSEYNQKIKPQHNITHTGIRATYTCMLFIVEEDLLRAKMLKSLGSNAFAESRLK